MLSKDEVERKEGGGGEEVGGRITLLILYVSVYFKRVCNAPSS